MTTDHQELTETYPEPLSNFAEGQWWVNELDALATSGISDNQKRAIAIVHHLLKAVALASAPPAPAASEPVQSFDLDANDWAAILQAVRESKWMPPEYMRNDWMSDVCSWLRNGPPAASSDALDARRYAYILDCEFATAKTYLPALDETEFKAKRRDKHDAAIKGEQHDR